MNNIFSRSVLILVLKILTSGLGLFFYYVVAKRLSPSEFGLFSIAMSCLLFSSAFAKQGLEQAIVRFAALANIRQIKYLYRFTTLYSAVSALIVALLIFIFSTQISHQLFHQVLLAELLPIVAALTLLQTWLAINSSFLKGRSFASSSLLFSGLLTVSLSLLFFYLVNPVSAVSVIKLFCYAALLSCLVSFIVTIYKLKLFKDARPGLHVSKIISRQVKNLLNISVLSLKAKMFRKNNNKHDHAKFLKVSRALFFASLAALMTQQLSTLVLARYVSLSEVGVYSLALKISLLLSYPLIVINAITAPIYAKLYAVKNLQQFISLAIKTRRTLTALASVAVVVLYYLVEIIISYFDGEYQLAIELVRILMIGQWVNLATGSAVSMLIMAGFENIHRRNVLIITVLNISALFFLVPTYGVYAAAWITTVVMSITNLLSYYFVNKLILQQASLK